MLMMLPRNGVAGWARRITLIALASLLVGSLALPGTEGAGHTAQVARLWQATRPIVLTDARRLASDEGYLQRRAAMLGPWLRLQRSLASAGAPPRTREVVAHILTLIGDLYGIYHYYSSPEQRAAARERAKKNLEVRLAAIDQEVSALPGLR